LRQRQPPFPGDSYGPTDNPPVVKMPVEAQVTDALRDSIVNGTITAGARITEIQISQQLNLSRAIIRTALHQLAKEGLLNLVPYTGWTVLSLSSRDVWELYTLRSAVERLAAQLVAGSINSSKSSRLKWAFEEPSVATRERREANSAPGANSRLHHWFMERPAGVLAMRHPDAPRSNSPPTG
jgi:DNA-binding GntR family transcriptional regulator